MKLTIRDAGESNFGKYSCVAKNPRGQTDGSITLYGKFLSRLCNTSTLIFQAPSQRRLATTIIIFNLRTRFLTFPLLGCFEHLNVESKEQIAPNFSALSVSLLIAISAHKSH